MCFINLLKTNTKIICFILYKLTPGGRKIHKKTSKKEAIETNKKTSVFKKKMESNSF